MIFLLHDNGTYLLLQIKSHYELFGSRVVGYLLVHKNFFFVNEFICHLSHAVNQIIYKYVLHLIYFFHGDNNM